MVKIYKIINQKLELNSLSNNAFLELDKLDNKTWIDINKVNNDILDNLFSLSNMNLDYYNSILDEEETAHIDNDDNNVLIVLDVPIC